jgi:tetratricopeptide (TPR) repeat protein
VAVARRVALTTACSVFLLLAPGCGKPHGLATQTPMLVAPDSIADLDDYIDARNAYALLELDDPARAPLRADLRDFLIGYLDQALTEGRGPAAVTALEQLAGLWLPAELRSPAVDPRLAAAALRVYAHVAPAGNERPALLALALAEAFGDTNTKAEVAIHYAELVDWVERTSDFGNDPRLTNLLDRLLEDVSAVLPSRFLVDRLSTLYLERYRAAQQRGPAGGGVDDRRITVTPYLLARLHLRADDLAGAIAAIDRLETDAATVELRNLIADALEAATNGRSPADLDELTQEFIPEPGNRLPAELVRQSWGIVDNLARRALQRYPDHPPAHLARGRVLRVQQLDEAAIIHYERAFAGKTRASDREDLLRAWSELADLYQRTLETRAESDPEAAIAMLGRIEDFHARAAQTWPQQPITPALNIAWMTIAAAEFDAGRIDRAQTLLEQAVAREPHPAALSLLGLIALRRGEFEQARTRLRRIDALAFEDQLDRYEWQIDSRIRLGEVELLAGDDAASVSHLRDALRQLNTLLGYPGLADLLRVEFLVRRAQVFFFLGEIELAMTDYRSAQTIAPERNSVYTHPLLFTVIHGHFEQAAEILSAALARDGGDRQLHVYFSMWVVDLATRLGRPIPKDAQAFLSSYARGKAGDPWLRRLARFGLGELGDGELAAAAGDPRQRSEAFFYEGLRRWRSGSKAAGLELMAKVLEQEMLGDFEYQMAQNYLRWNELPKTSRAALTSSR